MLSVSAPELTQQSQFVGLTSEEARRRLEQYGKNEAGARRAHSPWVDLLLLLSNPLAIVLLVAAVISAVIGQKIDAFIIILLVLIGAGIDFVQTYRSRIVIERLRASVATLASVERDGKWLDLPRAELVPGDLVRLCAGDLIPADAQLLSSRDLYVQQAILTGESAPAEKLANDAGPSTSGDAPNMVFLGTSVISGTAIAKVVATGPHTAFGDIAARLASRPPETAFDSGLRHFSYLITRVVFILVLFVITISFALHRPPLESLLFAVALAVGLTPEFLPMITSVTLSRGAMAMARSHVIVKHLPAIQNLGSIDVLCTDKTGTLTSGIMCLTASVNADGEHCGSVLDLAVINSSLQSGIHSPLDAAVLSASVGSNSAIDKLDEIPFDFQRRRLSVLIRNSRGERLLICKGSPEGILPLVSAVRETSGFTPITESTLTRINRYCSDQASEGFRVLAVATREVPAQEGLSVSSENSLSLEGFLSFADTILPDAAETIENLRQDGIAVKILSGDNELVAAHICRDSGLAVTQIVLGEQLDAMTDSALFQVAEETNVFARVSPPQKLRILNALRRRGHVVGFMGDGVNDAPSLHAADVGIAAPNAVDIAQDAADVVLLQPGLKVLHNGILEGRRAFGNVMKYLLMGTSSNFGNVLSMAVASVVLPFLPMLPTQVLLNNFLYDLSQLTIPTDNVDPEYYSKPQQWDISVIRRFMILIGPISSLFDFLTFYALLHFLHAGQAEFHTGWFVESLATQTLVLLVIRTTRSPFRSRPSPALLATVIGIVAAGIWLPYSVFAARLGFTPLPGVYFAFLGLVMMIYLALVEGAKRHILSPLKNRPRPIRG